MIGRKQNTTDYPFQFLMVDSADHLTAKTGLTPTVTLSKNGGAFAAAEGAVSEIGNGIYSLAGNAEDRDTLGELMIQASASGADTVFSKLLIVNYDPMEYVDALAKQIWEYPDRSLTENPTDLTSLVLLLTTIADNTGTAIPQLLAGLPAGVWSYITRTLTVSSVKPRTLPDGDQFSIYKDTSVLIPLTDLGDISAYTNLWFTMKREMDLQAGDEKAIIHADKVTGLLYIDQAVADDELGGITINDPTAGNISVWLHKSAAALLPVFSKEPLRWEVKGISPAGVDILLQGTNYILPAVTRKIT